MITFNKTENKYLYVMYTKLLYTLYDCYNIIVVVVVVEHT